MRYKDIVQFLRRESKKLPPDDYMAWSKYNGTLKNKDGFPLIGVWEAFPINHARRLKRIWAKTKSFEALNNYFLSYNLELKYVS